HAGIRTPQTSHRISLTCPVTCGAALTAKSQLGAVSSFPTRRSSDLGGFDLILTAANGGALTATSGDIVISGIVGGTAALTSLTAAGTRISVHAGKKRVAQAYTAAEAKSGTTLNGNLDAAQGGASRCT